MPIKPISVSQLNSYIKRILATDPVLRSISVTGEVSNLTKHNSGHIYFTLKDEKSRISCFFSAEKISKLRFLISEGMQVIVYGNVSLYEKGGSYSLNVQDIELSGQGALNIAFDNLKKKLMADGIFDRAHKKQLPEFPGRIVVITSPTGAAVRDIISTIRRRNTLVDLMVYPCLVQGDEAAQSIVKAISDVNRTFSDTDLIILTRGGGSLEDLWSFNEEIVARAVFESEIPIISAVGHETDIVMTDFAADVRAATPTAAAEVAVIDLNEIKKRLSVLDPSRLLYELGKKIEIFTEKCMYLRQNADSTIQFIFQDAQNKLALYALDLELSNPLNLLERGYAAIFDKKENWLESSKSVRVNDKIKVVMKDGTIHCIVETVEDRV